MNTSTITSTVPGNDSNLIRTIVRSAYDLQQLRIQMGNRITANFKAKLGITPDGMSEKELEKAEKSVLDKLRASYNRITDAVVAQHEGDDGEAEETINTGKLPTPKKFKGDELITTYTELVLVDQYVTILRDEEKQFSTLKKVLTGIPIYDHFLKDVRGIGPAMAGVLISEINIHKAEYPSSLWAYAGLDAVMVGVYTDDKGKEHRVPAWKLDAMFGQESGEMLIEGKYPVTMTSEGRSRKEVSLVDREYTNAAGEQAVRRSITYNPFLKTKLMGVLATSFLRSGIATVDGKKVGGLRRLAMAKAEGFVADETSDVEVADQAIAFLKARGHEVRVEAGVYAQAYYGYKNRLANDPRHAEKTEGHKHNMAMRFMVKRFLVNYYSHARALANLPVSPEYSEAVLGMVHGKSSENKGQHINQQKAA
jgi:hypothetical protein